MMNARSLPTSPAVRLVALAAMLTACTPSGGISQEQGHMSTVASPRAAAEPTATQSASAASSVTTAPASTSEAGEGLPVEGFAWVVADRLQMRVSPSLEADVVVEPLFGDYPPGTSFPPVAVGRQTASTLVYLLEGPVAADGFDWYRVVIDDEFEAGHIGWVAAGDAEDAWLEPATANCPTDPIELADVTMSAMSRLRAIHCLGGRDITLRGYYVAPPPGEPEDGECVSEPAWLVCSFGWHGLRTLEAEWAGDANNLGLHLHPELGSMPPRPGWIEVTGQFDHPAATQCGDGSPASILSCRMKFVVISARRAD